MDTTTHRPRRIVHAAHEACTGRPLWDLEQIEVPFAERNGVPGFTFHVGFMRDGQHFALMHRTVPPSDGECPRCKPAKLDNHYTGLAQ